MDIDFLGGWDEWQDRQFNAENTANLYIDYDKDAKKQASAVIRPGRKALVDLPSGNVSRALSVEKDALYAVSSDQIYKLDSGLTPLHINSALSLLTSTGYIGIASNANNEILFVDGAAGYLYRNSVPSFQKIEAENFPSNPTACAVLDGYFIVNKSGTNENHVSALNDGLTWTLDSAARRFDLTYKTDVVTAYATLNRNLYVFGKLCCEVWANIGAPGQVPLRRNNALSMEYGCAAVNTIATGYGVLIWLSSTQEGVGSIMLTDGTRPSAISTKPIDDVIQSYGDISNSIGYIYKISGHIFYDITFPASGKTWTYDLTTKLWFGKYELGNKRYIANCHAFFANKHIIGAYNGKMLYELSSNYTTDNGSAIPFLRISKHTSSQDYKRLQLHRIQFDIMAGVAASNGIDAAPTIFFSVSKDGGITYSLPQRKTYTEIGKYRSRSIFYKRGISRVFTFKLEGYTSLPFRILGAAADIEELYG